MPNVATIDPGTLFKAEGVYAIKSEYFYPSGQCECILLSSGEYAHFSQGNDTPVEISHFHTALEETRGELTRRGRALNDQSRALADTVAELARLQSDTLSAYAALEQAQRSAEAAATELAELRAHVERVFGGVTEPSIVVRELLRRARK